MWCNLVTYYVCLTEFWRITFSTNIWHRTGLALYRDSKEQYKPIVWLQYTVIFQVLTDIVINYVLHYQWCSSRDFSLGLETSRDSDVEVSVLKVQILVLVLNPWLLVFVLKVQSWCWPWSRRCKPFVLIACHSKSIAKLLFSLHRQVLMCHSSVLSAVVA